MKSTVIIPAGGLGTRVGTDMPKQFFFFFFKPIIIHTLEAFEKAESVESVIISVSKDWYAHTKDLVKEHRLTKVKEIVYAGERRQDSVYNALVSDSAKDAEIVLVHDAVRPFVSPELINSIIEEVEETGAAIPVLTPGDTVKERTSKNYILKTFNRINLCLAQTPQGFWYDILLSAYNNARDSAYEGTDSASLVEFLGYKIAAVQGDDMNIKITTPFDLKVGEMILNEK